MSIEKRGLWEGFWDFWKNLHIQNLLAIIIILVCCAVVLISAFREIPQESKHLIDKFFDMSLVGVVGWAFTQSKRTTNAAIAGTTTADISASVTTTPEPDTTGK